MEKMVIWLIVLLASSMLIVWVIRDGVKNPGKPKERSEEYYDKVDKAFKVIIAIVSIIFVIGVIYYKEMVERDLDRMTKELMEVYDKINF